MNCDLRDLFDLFDFDFFILKTNDYDRELF